MLKRSSHDRCIGSVLWANLLCSAQAGPTVIQAKSPVCHSNGLLYGLDRQQLNHIWSIMYKGNVNHNHYDLYVSFLGMCYCMLWCNVKLMRSGRNLGSIWKKGINMGGNSNFVFEWWHLVLDWVTLQPKCSSLRQCCNMRATASYRCDQILWARDWLMRCAFLLSW